MSSTRSRLASAARRRSSASCRRECSPEMPAASSSRARRCGRLGGDQLADLALAHHGGGMGAGRGIGEQQLHVAGAHFLAIDAIDRAGLALDAAGDFQDIGIVERGGRGAVGIVEDQRDFGGVARRPVARARKDHVVHARGAHGLVGAFAHHPAHGFDQVGLAAAIGADNAGQARLHMEHGLVGEGFEAVQLEAGELHGAAM